MPLLALPPPWPFLPLHQRPTQRLAPGSLWQANHCYLPLPSTYLKASAGLPPPGSLPSLFCHHLLSECSMSPRAASAHLRLWLPGGSEVSRESQVSVAVPAVGLCGSVVGAVPAWAPESRGEPVTHTHTHVHTCSGCRQHGTGPRPGLRLPGQTWPWVFWRGARVGRSRHLQPLSPGKRVCDGGRPISGSPRGARV